MEIYVPHKDTDNSACYISAGEIMSENGIEEIKKIKMKEDEIQSMLDAFSAECKQKLEAARHSMENEIRETEERLSREYDEKIKDLQKNIDQKIEDSREKARKEAEAISLKLTDKKAAEMLFKFLKESVE